MCMVLTYANQCFGDMGVISWICAFLMAATVAHTGKLAVAVGAWPREDTVRVSPASEPPGAPPVAPPRAVPAETSAPPTPSEASGP
jgi:hypothetical protein